MRNSKFTESQIVGILGEGEVGLIDCNTRELLRWHLSRSGKSRTAESALEQALIARYGCLGKLSTPFLLRSDNGLVFTNWSSSRPTARSKTGWWSG
jgi:hypothetical protein